MSISIFVFFFAESIYSSRTYKYCSVDFTVLPESKAILHSQQKQTKITTKKGKTK